MRTLLLVSLIAGLLAGCDSKQGDLTETERSALTDTIAERMQEYADALGSLDPQQMEPFYVDDPDFRVYSDGQILTRDELLGAIGSMSTSLQSVEGIWDSIEVTPLGRDAALAAARFRRIMIDTAGVVINEWGTVTWVWVYHDEEWRLIHGQAVHYPDETS